MCTARVAERTALSLILTTNSQKVAKMVPSNVNVPEWCRMSWTQSQHDDSRHECNNMQHVSKGETPAGFGSAETGFFCCLFDQPATQDCYWQFKKITTSCGCFFKSQNVKLQWFSDEIGLPLFLCPPSVDHTCIAVSACLCFCLCRQLDWRPEKQGELRKRHEKVVIIRNMFHPSDFEVQTETVSTVHLHGLHL